MCSCVTYSTFRIIKYYKYLNKTTNGTCKMSCKILFTKAKSINKTRMLAHMFDLYDMGHKVIFCKQVYFKICPYHYTF